ncbi:MAG: hypothetical protein R3D01_04690 [Hyphomicrobiales bacterium]
MQPLTLMSRILAITKLPVSVSSELGDLDRDFAAILVAAGLSRAVPSAACLGILRYRPIFLVSTPNASGYEDIDRLVDELLARIAKKLLSFGVGHDDLAGLIDDEHAIRERH